MSLVKVRPPRPPLTLAHPTHPARKRRSHHPRVQGMSLTLPSDDCVHPRTRQDKKNHPHHHHPHNAATVNTLSHPYGARYGTESLPKYHIPSKGVSAETAYQLIHDELSTDGHPTLKYACHSAVPSSLIPFAASPRSCRLGCPNLPINSCRRTCPRT